MLYVCMHAPVCVCVFTCVEAIIQHRFARNLLCLCQALGISMTNKIDMASKLTGLAEGDKH